MTIGTAIVLSVGIICGTFLVACVIGACLTNKKSKAAEQLTQTLTNEISSRLKDAISKK